MLHASDGAGGGQFRVFGRAALASQESPDPNE
jgi:hypothetical protein